MLTQSPDEIYAEIRRVFAEEAAALLARIERCEIDQSEVRSWGQRAERAVEVLDRWSHLAGVMEVAARTIQQNSEMAAENARLHKQIDRLKRKAKRRA